MRMQKIALASGALLGLLAVVLGAFAAHKLEGILEPKYYKAFETGARYQMYHALLLLVLSRLPVDHSRLLKWAIWTALLGIILFSGSLYLLSKAPVGIITPIGGVLFIISWGLLAAWAFSDRS